MDDKLECNYQLSPYSFCNGDPVNHIDIDGHLAIFINGYDLDFSGGKARYWNGKDKMIMDIIGDYHFEYIDGSPKTIFSNIDGEYRENKGLEKAREIGKTLLASLKKGETIKIITHSMGARYAKGFLKGLINVAKECGLIKDGEERKLFEFELDLAPYHPENQYAILSVPTVAIHHEGDKTAGTETLPGAFNFTNKICTKMDPHSIRSFRREEIIRALILTPKLFDYVFSNDDFTEATGQAKLYD